MSLFKEPDPVYLPTRACFDDVYRQQVHFSAADRACSVSQTVPALPDLDANSATRWTESRLLLVVLNLQFENDDEKLYKQQ